MAVFLVCVLGVCGLALRGGAVCQSEMGSECLFQRMLGTNSCYCMCKRARAAGWSGAGSSSPRKRQPPCSACRCPTFAPPPPRPHLARPCLTDPLPPPPYPILPCPSPAPRSRAPAVPMAAAAQRPRAWPPGALLACVLVALCWLPACSAINQYVCDMAFTELNFDYTNVNLNPAPGGGLNLGDRVLFKKVAQRPCNGTLKYIDCLVTTKQFIGTGSGLNMYEAITGTHAGESPASYFEFEIKVPASGSIWFKFQFYTYQTWTIAGNPAPNVVLRNLKVRAARARPAAGERRGRGGRASRKGAARACAGERGQHAGAAAQCGRCTHD